MWGLIRTRHLSDSANLRGEDHPRHLLRSSSRRAPPPTTVSARAPAASRPRSGSLGCGTGCQRKYLPGGPKSHSIPSTESGHGGIGHPLPSRPEFHSGSAVLHSSHSIRDARSPPSSISTTPTATSPPGKSNGVGTVKVPASMTIRTPVRSPPRTLRPKTTVHQRVSAGGWVACGSDVRTVVAEHGDDGPGVRGGPTCDPAISQVGSDIDAEVVYGAAGLPAELPS
jgi:hypothetical protein